ncbi:hypothetical protein BRADI_2g48345v3 [Brachypodium distachyon]|uniref:Uncharacterized protein n=1 Tax=Brachypodium distachyon TaxID=15368 RepID=A0A0Q3GGG3_BRADI|nr:hypothetical protein BRADI_2g48345v3 [Brachypodium distachyon]
MTIHCTTRHVKNPTLGCLHGPSKSDSRTWMRWRFENRILVYRQ